MAEPTLDELFKINLPQYIWTIQNACAQVKKVLDACATSCIVPTEDDFKKLKLVFGEAVKNIHARKVVQDYDLAARALITANPKGKKQEANHPQPCAPPGSASGKLTSTCFPMGGQMMATSRDAICCDQMSNLPVTVDGQTRSGIAIYVASVLAGSKYVIGWENPTTTNLLTAFKWAILGKGQDGNTFPIQMLLLNLMGKAPIPVSWNTPILDAIAQAQENLAQKDLTLSQRQGFANIALQVSSKLTTEMTQQRPPASTAVTPAVPPPAPPPKPKPQDWLTTNWKPVTFAAGSGLVAFLLIYFTRQTHR